MVLSCELKDNKVADLEPLGIVQYDLPCNIILYSSINPFEVEKSGTVDAFLKM